MTICLGFQQPGYICMAADTRINFGDPTFFVQDGKQKLLETGIGLVAGSGLSQLLDAVTDRFTIESITSTSQIECIIRQEIEVLYTKQNKNPSSFYTLNDLERYIHRTNWIFSYTTMTEDGDPDLRLSLFSGPESQDSDGTIYRVVEGGVGLLLPDEFDACQLERYSDHLNSELKPVLKSNPREDIPKICGIFSDLIGEISEQCDSVSKEFHFGIHAIGYVDIYSPPSVDALITMSKEVGAA